MKKNIIAVGIALLFSAGYCMANTGGKEKKEDPDMVGFVIEAESGRPLRDVNITAYTNDKKEKATISNANGSFTLADLKPGIYKLVFQKDGFQKVIREKMVLKPKEDCQLNVQMASEDNMFDLMPSPFRFSSR